LFDCNILVLEIILAGFELPYSAFTKTRNNETKRPKRNRRNETTETSEGHDPAKDRIILHLGLKKEIGVVFLYVFLIADQNRWKKKRKENN